MKAAVLYGAKDLRIEPYRNPELRPGMVLLRNRRVGICGSDMHYYELGYCASFVPDRPFIMGHELTAEVAAVSDDVDNVKVGARVTANPACACGFCAYCKAGRGNLCSRTIMLGSGSTTPPTDGAMAEFVIVRADQCHMLPKEVDDGLGAMMEPFAVALNAPEPLGCWWRLRPRLLAPFRWRLATLWPRAAPRRSRWAWMPLSIPRLEIRLKECAN
jgi:threonine dehydrogenase-like Zn-dependent dehydrogenase